MATRIEKAIVRGEISNETPGFVTGRLWLAGRAAPLVLNLRGNCLRDIAGCTLTFVNPHPEREQVLDILSEVQDGAVGDMTASRKSRVPTVADAEVMRLLENRLPVPTRLVNCLYLEWFSAGNGRLVIETCEFTLEISPPAWTMSAEEEAAQTAESQQTFHRYLDVITGMDLGDDDEDEPFEADEEEEDDFSNESLDGFQFSDEPLNEFEWEQELRDADRRAEAYQEAFDRYHDHPERERLICEAMGWDPEEVDELTDELSEVAEAMQPDDPGMLIENATSIATDNEDDHHPLSRRAMNFALHLQSEAERRGLLGPDVVRDSPVLTVIVSIIAMGGKLAAALDPMVEGLEPEPGFVIAMLKRAQVPLNEAMHALSSIDMRQLGGQTKRWLTRVRHELFSLRNDILDVMKEQRARQ
jgi:hypothetical protein